MYKNFAREHNQTGQTAVLFALMIIGLVAFIGLAVDGGSYFSARRVTQNAADSAAMTGVHYIRKGGTLDETRLLEVVNSIIEANGIPDTNDVPGDSVNENVTAYYTDDSGNRRNPGCNVVGQCGGDIPLDVRGLEVIVNRQVATYFLGVIDRNSLDVAAEAVAVSQDGEGAPGVGNNVLFAFGSCTNKDEKQLDISSNNVDFIGDVHSNTWFINRGSDNHYHGKATYGDNYDDPGGGEYDAGGAPQPGDVLADPYLDEAGAVLEVTDFNCNDGIGSGVTCHDLTNPPPDDGVINNNDLGSLLQRDGNSYRLEDGLYYAGQYPIRIGETRMVGNVTIVSEGYIKLTGSDLQLTAYLKDEGPIPNLLLYSTLDPADGGFDACSNFDEVVDDDMVPINLSGPVGSASDSPGVFHEDDKDGCVDLNNPARCYAIGGLYYKGIIYAPYGRVATSGKYVTYHGAIVAPTIRINGYGERNEGGGDKPDRVGALFISDPVPDTDAGEFITLER